MLHFLNKNIYYTYELSNDIADEVWTTEYPACVNDEDGEGIYEGVKLHKFNYLKDITQNLDIVAWFKDKQNIMFNKPEMLVFSLAWYDSCVQRHAISNCVDMTQWIVDYDNCYKSFYERADVYEGALGYYEALAVSELHKTIFSEGHAGDLCGMKMDKLNPIPEVSWMLADYIHGGRKSVWSIYLTEYIRGNIRGMLYKRGIMGRAWVGFPSVDIPLDLNMTIDDVDLTDTKSVWYFDNPYNLDFHTNYCYIKRLLEVDK